MERKKEELNIPVMIFTIIGVVLVVFGVLLLKHNSFKLKVISTEGTVIGVQTKTTADGVVESRSITLAYKASGSDYNAVINNYSKEMQIGEKMTLYYDFFSPNSVDNKRTGYLEYLVTLIGVILVFKTGPRFFKIVKDNYL